MLIHAGIKPFRCSECGNTFTSNKSLKNHMLIHAGIKPFSCSQCGKSFTRKRQLKDHLITHSSEKPFSCFQCGNTFMFNKSLKNHMLIHTFTFINLADAFIQSDLQLGNTSSSSSQRGKQTKKVLIKSNFIVQKSTS